MIRKEDFGPLGEMIKRHGFFASRRALVFLASSAIFVHETDEEPTIEALSEFWGQSERTTYRELASWRKVTGGAEVEEAAREVVAVYRAELLRRENVDALAFEMGRFIPAV